MSHCPLSEDPIKEKKQNFLIPPVLLSLSLLPHHISDLIKTISFYYLLTLVLLYIFILCYVFHILSIHNILTMILQLLLTGRQHNTNQCNVFIYYHSLKILARIKTIHLYPIFPALLHQTEVYAHCPNTHQTCLSTTGETCNPCHPYAKMLHADPCFPSGGLIK